MIDKATLDKWTDMARRDDWHQAFVGSDIRQMLGEIERLSAYSMHERSLGAEGPMIELTGLQQEAVAVVASIRAQCGHLSKIVQYGPGDMFVGKLLDAAKQLERVAITKGEQ